MMLRILLAVVTASAVADAPADQPPISNAKLSTGSAAAGLEPALRAVIARPSPGWVGYVVPKIPGDGRSCCRDDQGQGCGLEGKRTAAAGSSDRPVKLEGPSHVAILIRAEQGQVSKIRAFSNDCPLDAGGLPLLWLTAVKPPESVGLAAPVRERLGAGRNRSSAEAAVHALALHAGAGAGTALEKLAGSAQASEKVRKSAIFWLANARGRDGYLVVSRLVREDPSPALREHAVFALTQSEEPEAIPTIVRVAREDRSPKVRGQALFWLAQKASRQASARHHGGHRRRSGHRGEEEGGVRPDPDAR